MARTSKNKDPKGPSKLKAPVQITGGSGFRFENSVAARFLLDMLTGKNSLDPDLGRVVRVDWQARDAGWPTIFLSPAVQQAAMNAQPVSRLKAISS